MEKNNDFKAKVIKVYPQLDDTHKTLFEDLFGKKIFITSIAEWEAYIIPRVNTFEDACAEEGEDPKDPKFSWGDPDDQAYQKKKVIIRALNGPFVLNYDDTTQQKWEPWMKKTPTGFRLGVSCYGVAPAYATGGSRASLCSKKISDHFGTAFEALINQFLN